MKEATFVGSEIKSFRKEAGLTQQNLAAIAGIDRGQLSKIEKGISKGVTYNTIDKIFKSMGYELLPTSHLLCKKRIQPFVKWVGGKTQLLEKIKKLMPSNFNNYYEPFVGGGALFFKIKPSSFFINDMNKELIYAYQCFTNPNWFFKLKNELEKHEMNHSEEYYLKVRAMDRKNEFSNLSIYKRAARIIYLNKSCFNGLYRVNSKGYFNVPSGKKTKVNTFSRDNFEKIFSYLNNQHHKITNLDFELSVQTAQKGDFVYFDPPYDTWKEKKSFTSYNKNNFGKEEQKRLARVFRELSNKGVYVMLSNHNTDFIQELYKDYNIYVIPAKRMINSKGNQRGCVEEVLITNYKGANLDERF